MSNRKKQLDDYMGGMLAIGKEAPEVIKAIDDLQKTVGAPGALDAKVKELICIAVCCAGCSKYGVIHHTGEALKRGASREEIVEAAMVSVLFGGHAAMAFAATTLKETLDEFGAV